MSLSEILAKKAADEAALKAVQPKIMTGAEGSVSAPPVPTEAAKPEVPSEDLVARYKNYPEGSYIMLRQKFLILNSGAKIKPDAMGVITPENEEQKKALEYLLKQDRNLVSLIPGKE